MKIEFEPISLEGQVEYEKYLSACPQHPSDYSFVNLWGWKDNYNLEWAFLPDLVLIRQNNNLQRCWAPVGNWQAFDWQNIESCLRSGMGFVRVPEDLKNIWVKQIENVEVQESREHWDYLYSRQELVELKGNRFHKKKNLMRQFERNYEFEYVHLDSEQIEKALTLQTEWLLWRNRENDSTLEAENKAIVRVMHDWERLHNIMGGGLIVEGRMVAYTIAEPLGENSIVIHFEKGCPNFKGVYQAINQRFLSNSVQNFEFVNREQDLGDEGLRKAKQSYNPIGYVKKYEIKFS